MDYTPEADQIMVVRTCRGVSLHRTQSTTKELSIFGGMCFCMCSTFYSLEDSQLPDPSNDIHKLSLQIVYLAEIQKSLERFNEARNDHALRTPTQIWTEGMLLNMATDISAINNVFGENPFRLQNLEAVLAQHGTDSLPTSDGDSHQQQESISHTTDHISDLKIKYMTCCAEMSNVMAT